MEQSQLPTELQQWDLQLRTLWERDNKGRSDWPLSSIFWSPKRGHLSTKD